MFNISLAGAIFYNRCTLNVYMHTLSAVLCSYYTRIKAKDIESTPTYIHDTFFSPFIWITAQTNSSKKNDNKMRRKK